jgi:4-hydroxy-tetrahydrodipicolinate synthase
MAREIPTFRYVKDEAGPTLTRISWFRQNAPDTMHVFTGAHGRTLLDEMARGSSGTMPAASFADLYVAVWNLWHAGKRDEATAAFAKVSLLVSEVQVYGIESLKYILHLRSVFPLYAVRKRSGALPGSTGLEPGAVLDEEGKGVIRELLSYLKPDLRS